MNLDNLLGKIIDSIFYKNSVAKAGKISSDSNAMLSFLKKVLIKAKSLGAGGMVHEIRNKVYTLVKLIKSYAVGEYKEIETKNIVIILSSLLYFLLPIDFIPDFLPVLGFADDIALLTFVLNSLSVEIEKYEIWEINQILNK
jgi:uncharacterized membrane protein YkvA (DUF1232 family)